MDFYLSILAKELRVRKIEPMLCAPGAGCKRFRWAVKIQEK